jgi:hypothetical protein
MEHSQQSLEDWARSFGGTAILGLICALLIAGKFLHFVLQRRGLIFGYLVVPPSIISGIIGLLWFMIIDRIDPVMAEDLRSGIEALRRNLVSFVFAAFALGLMCTKTNSLHTSNLRGLALSILHEGMPMMIYSQILLWGQTSCCLLIYLLLYGGSEALFPTMVTLGAEAGMDVAHVAGYSGDWLATAVEAESIAIVAVNILGVLLISLKPYLLAGGYLGSQYSREARDQLSSVRDGKAEAFEKAAPLLHRSFSHEHLPMRSSSIASYNRTLLDKDELVEDYGEEHGVAIERASLGTHLSFIALAVFLSFSVSLLFHLFEAEFQIRYHLLSGLRQFKVAMVCAVLCMLFITRRSNLRFRRDWFMRLCGLLLDLLTIAALAKAYPRKQTLEQQTHYFLCFLFVSICVLWNLFCFCVVAKEVFPNYWYERALTLSGDSLGRAYSGLLFARTLDPNMESPVPAAYAAKLMLFFVPTSGAKANIVYTITSLRGPAAALLVCVLVLLTWAFVFRTHFQMRFLKYKQDPAEEVGSSSVGNAAMETMGLLSEVDSSGTTSTTSTSADMPNTPKTTSFASSSTHTVLSNRSGKAAATHRTSATHSSLVQELALLDTVETGTAAATLGQSLGLGNISPRCSEASSIMSPAQIEAIVQFLPEAKRTKAWQLGYGLRVHGACLSTLLAVCSRNSISGQRLSLPCVLVIEDSWGYIFGGYISPGLQDKKTYYGNGESFVFTIAPNVQAYRWTERNHLFILSQPQCLAMGGGGEGFALQLDDELDTGVSCRSETFDNPTLSSNEFFKCLNVEVWLLDNVGGYSV